MGRVLDRSSFRRSCFSFFRILCRRRLFERRFIRFRRQFHGSRGFCTHFLSCHRQSLPLSCHLCRCFGFQNRSFRADGFCDSSFRDRLFLHGSLFQDNRRIVPDRFFIDSRCRPLQGEAGQQKSRNKDQSKIDSFDSVVFSHACLPCNVSLCRRNILAVCSVESNWQNRRKMLRQRTV